MLACAYVIDWWMPAKLVDHLTAKFVNCFDQMVVNSIKLHLIKLNH